MCLPTIYFHTITPFIYFILEISLIKLLLCFYYLRTIVSLKRKNSFESGNIVAKNVVV